MDSLGLGLLLVFVGLLFFGTARLFARGVSRMVPAEPDDVLTESSTEEDFGEAVLLVEAGGRVRSINARGRQIFHIQETEQPDLERMARRIRPADAFLSLCAGQTKARFTLDGRFVEGVSYRLAYTREPLVLVTLRFPELAAGLAGETGTGSAQTLQTFTGLTVEISASLDLENTLRAVLENVEKLVPADFLEITLWDSETGQLIPYHYIWISSSERALEPQTKYYSPMDGYTGYLCRQHTSLLVQDVDKRDDIHPAEGRTPGMRSYLGVPLMVGQDFIGTLELGSRVPDSFREEDLALVKLLSSQAATALHNALVYRQEQRRSAELSGLSQMAQAFGSVRDTKSLYSRLIQSIAPLMKVEIVGFLLYNEAQRTLEAQIPFHGLPDQIVELYRAPVVANGVVEQTLLDQDVLISEDASSDPLWETMGISFVAQAASLRETVLVPLNSGGRMLGYLQASNRMEPGSFTQSELHLLTIVANQTAAIIENAHLVQQSRTRALRAEALRKIASLASSAATLDEILRHSIAELAHLLHANVGTVFLLDPSRSVLELQQSATHGDTVELEERVRRLMVDDPQFPFTVTDTQRALQVERITEATALVPFYMTVLSAWKVQSLIIVPLVVRSEGIGEILFGSRQANFFDTADVQLVATAAGQLAGAAEQMFLRSQTDEDLRKRVDQLSAITRASRELMNTLDPSVLLRLVFSEATRLSGATCGSAVLLDTNPDHEEIGIRLFHGEAVTTEPGTLAARVIADKLPMVVDDWGESGLHSPHAGIASAAAVPVFHRQKLVGLVLLHADLPEHFGRAEMEALQTFAVQAGVALGNAAQYDEQTRRSSLLKRELDTLTELLRVSQMLRPSLPLEESLVAIGGAIKQATPFQVNVISVYEPETQELRRVVSTGLSNDQWADLQAHRLPWTSALQLLQVQFRTGNVYYIPADKTPVIPPDVHTLDVSQEVERATGNAWDPDDFLLVPLYDSQNEPLGLISVDVPSDGLRPDRPTFEALEIFGIQAGLMIENHRRTSGLIKKVESLEAEITQASQAARAASQNLPVMLRKDLDQTTALLGLNRRIERIRASLDIAAQANSETSTGAILQSLCRGLLTRFGMRTALIAEGDETGVRLLDIIGTVPANTNPEALFGQRNPLRSMLQESKKDVDVLLIPALGTQSEWAGNPLLNGLAAQSVIGLLLSGGVQRTAVLVVGQRSLGVISEEDRQIFEQLARQVSTGLQNLRLLTETRRRLEEVNLLLGFSRKLGSLEAESILNVLLESVREVLPNAQAGWAGIYGSGPAQGVLVPQAASGYIDQDAQLTIHYRTQTEEGSQPSLLARVFATGEPLRDGDVNFAVEYHLAPDDLLKYRQSNRGRLPVSCMILPLRIADRVSGALVLENFDTPNAFSLEDETLAHSFSRQAALALDNARLYQSAELRALQMQNLTRASGTLTSSLNRDELINSLLDLLRDVVPYDTATLWMRRANVLSVLAARGFEDDDGQIGLSAAVEDSALFLEMIRTGEAIAIADIRADRRFPSLVEPSRLSWLGLPLIVNGEVVGLVAMEKERANFFSAEHILAASTFSAQAAAAMENARLFEESVRRAGELDQRSQRLALLNRLSEELGSSLDIGFILKLTAQHLLTAMNASDVACVMVGPGNKYILEVEVPPQTTHLPVALLDMPLFDRLRDSRGIYSTPNVVEEAELAELREHYLAMRSTQSLLIIPLLTGSALHGWLLVQKDHLYRFSLPEIELARTMCNQAAIAIQNARLFDETRSLTEFLERRVEERTGELRKEHQNSQTLLKVIGELSTSLDMGLVLNRALAVINDSLGSQESLTLLLESSQKPYHAGEALLNMGDLSYERMLTRSAARSRQPEHVDDVLEDTRWKEAGSPQRNYRSVLIVPLVMGEDALGSLLLFHRNPGYFHDSQIGLAEAVARQIAIAINNAELFNLIRDQSENLGHMLREQQIEASRSRAILEAVADGVVVTDASGKVTLFNESAQRVLSLKSSDILDKPVDQFSKLLGRSGSEWLRTVRTWSQDPQSYHSGPYADRFDMEDGTVIAVHLAPAFWRSQFLGTVSIFRDITHEVQVDRMKSEFVANVSHELRTPMTSIKGYVEIMLMGASGDLTDQQRHFLEIVRNNTERLSVLVNDLLDISRMETGRVTLNLQEVDLGSIAGEVLAELRQRSQEEQKIMHFELEVEPDLPPVLGDVERIRQVIANLAVNGYNYSLPNGKVRVRIHANDGDVQVDVVDHGIGIRPDEQERIFERFYRGEDPLVLATAGTGLGLAVARTLVSMHNGKLWFTSSGLRGEGSVFSFTLPTENNNNTEN